MPKVVVLTRSPEQNARIASQLQGACVLSLPTLAITPLSFQLPPQWDESDFVFFVSPTAVHIFFQQVHTWPVGLKAAAVGKGTWQALKEAGLHEDQCWVSDQGLADTQGFIQFLQAKNLRPKQVLIVRATTGRNELRDYLQSQGTQVTVLPVYQRQATQWSDNDFHRLAQAVQKKSSFVFLVTSQESLHALVPLALKVMSPDQFWTSEFVVIHPRIAQALVQKASQTGLMTCPSSLKITTILPEQIIQTLQAKASV